MNPIVFEFDYVKHNSNDDIIKPYFSVNNNR